MKVFSVLLIHMVFLSTTISASSTLQTSCGWKKDTVNYFSWWQWHARLKAQKISSPLFLFSFGVNVACPICNCLFISRPSPDGWLLLRWIGPWSGNARGGLLSVEISPVFSHLSFAKRQGRKDHGSPRFLPSLHYSVWMCQGIFWDNWPWPLILLYLCVPACLYSYNRMVFGTW